MKELSKKKAISMLPSTQYIYTMKQAKLSFLDKSSHSAEYIKSLININPCFKSGKVASRMGYGLAIKIESSYLFVLTRR